MSGMISVSDARKEPFESLFLTEKILRDEINARAWEFLKNVGYDWYTTKSISVIMLMRGKVNIVQITAVVERNHIEQEIKSEVTLRVFEMTLARDIQGV
jgi:hypothetical protein